MAGTTLEVSVNQGISFQSTGIYDVRAYGAVADGVTDDTTAIQTAIDACGAAGGGIVQLSHGNSIHSGLNVNYNYVTIQGVGDYASRLTMTSVASIALDVASTVAVSNLTLKNFSLLGNSTNLGGIHLGTDSPLYYTVHTLMDDVTVSGFENASSGYGYGICMQTIQQTEFAGCRIIHNTNNYYRPTGGFATTIKITGTTGYIGHAGNIGLLVEGHISDIELRDIVVENSQNEGIYFDTTATSGIVGSALVLDGCYFEANLQSLSGDGHISINGGAGLYDKHKLVVVNCEFHNTAISSVHPYIAMDNVVGGYIAGNNRLTPLLITTTSTVGCTFHGNGTMSSADFRAGLVALSGDISGIESYNDSGSRKQVNYLPSIVMGGDLDVTTGSGTPNGTITAKAGSVYLQTDGGGSTTLWSKELGTSNSGWASCIAMNLNGTVTLANGVRIDSGSGSPEGVVASPEGSSYTNTDGGAGTTLYIKETGGVSNTGWVAK